MRPRPLRLPRREHPPSVTSGDFSRRDRGPSSFSFLSAVASGEACRRGLALRAAEEPPDGEGSREAAGDLVEVEASGPEVPPEDTVVRGAPGAEARGVN